MAEYGRNLYVAGGLEAAPVATVSVGTIGPDGSVTAWTPTTPLPMPNLPGLAAYNGWVYAVLSSGAVCRSRILPGGGLDNWIIEPEAVDPSNAYSTVLKEYRGVLYLFGRWASSPANVIRIAAINPDGSVGAWRSESLPWALYRPAAQFYNNRVYLAGGLASWFFMNDVSGYTYSAPVFADGTPGAWRNEMFLPLRLWMHSSVVVSNEFYIMGGLTNQDYWTASSAVFRGTISDSDGSVTTWPLVDSLPSAFVFGNAAVYSPFSQNIYLLGGANAVGQMSPQVWRKSLAAPTPQNNAPEAAISVSPVVQLPGYDSPVVLCLSAPKARVTLDASASSDADNDPLTFEWKVDGLPVSAEAVATAELAIGKHAVGLKANDGKASDWKEIEIEVVSAIGSLNLLINAVVDSAIPENRKTPLLASLTAAEAALNRGNQIAALNQLGAFQNKLSAQIASPYPDLATAWGDLARLIAATISGQP